MVSPDWIEFDQSSAGWPLGTYIVFALFLTKMTLNTMLDADGNDQIRKFLALRRIKLISILHTPVF